MDHIHTLREIDSGLFIRIPYPRLEKEWKSIIWVIIKD